VVLSEFNFTGSGSIGIFDLLCYSNNNIDVFLMVGHKQDKKNKEESDSLTESDHEDESIQDRR
jgi:hypothetical protein